MKPRIWDLHGITIIHREMEIGEVTHCTYEERIIGPKIGDAVVKVVDYESYQTAIDALKLINEYFDPEHFCEKNCGGSFHEPECEIQKRVLKTLIDLGEMTTPEREG